MVRNILAIVVFFSLAYIFDWLFFDRKGDFVAPEMVGRLISDFQEKPNSNSNEIIKPHTIDCGEAKDDAITNTLISDEIKSFASVSCWSFGHIFGPINNKTWLYNLESSDMTIYPDRLIILADQRGNAVGYNGEILPPLYHQAYFTQIGHSFIEDPKDRLLFAQNVNLAWQKFHFNIDVNDLSSIHRVSIKTYADISIFLYLAEFNENKIGGDSRLASGFGYICYEPDCTPEKIFRVIDIEEATKPEAFKGIIIPQDS